ncbi:alpha/beta hydrolase [Pseudaquabacterium pictum]|uniref:Alpha/beta hydrolase n=1 Tax=Pseudaquabacterium pictum TaxID=2315236 RepID=A0A480AL47_9BURK|nr:alpha/beta hydrolase [Rubrivivax pictus]GCL61127.1 hypothetical protein AQPW35_02080 [Rubrivivax pictus]
MVHPHTAAPGFWRGFVVLGAAALLAAAAGAQPLPPAGPDARFAALATEPDDGAVLVRPALRAPARWRVLIVPGSGCASLAPSADRLARGLRQAQVVLLQKPALSPPGQPCSRAHLQADNLADWQQRALRLAAQGLASTDAQLPLVLVGLSEGAELLPGLAAARAAVAALVLVGHAGLDPAEAGALQAARQGQSAAWWTLMAETRGARDDDALLQGRHWRYWQVLQRWPLQAPLLADARPLLRAWGGADALMPATAYQRFADLARRRPAPFCDIRFPRTDHELREPGADRLQQLWRWLDQTAAAMATQPGATIPLQDCAAWQAEAAQP